ncbi:MAG TPA: hypothetical protein VGG12_07555 [Methylovirgula sp.]
MSIDEIVHTCSHEKVAQAALESLGFAFAMHVRNAAEGHGVSAGAFVARVVHEFGNGADTCERRALEKTMERADQPILVGLRAILHARLNATESEGRWPVGKMTCPSRPDWAEHHVG